MTVDRRVDDGGAPLTGPELIANIHEELDDFHTRVSALETATDAPGVVALASDVTNNNGVANTIADVTALQFPVVNGGRYEFRFVIPYTAQATTTGSRWSINGPAFTSLYYRSEYTLTGSSRTLNESLSAYDTPAASNASSGATAANMAIIEGVILAAADGNVVARFASEVSSSAIVAKAGAFVSYRRLN